MALRSIFIILAIIFPAMVSAMDFMVGDDKGWTINFDYQTWAQGKDFRVGDRLGKDIIVLATPGRKWYLCGVGKHCAAGGQKLAITVQPQMMAPSPAPTPSFGSSQALPYTNSANGITANFQSVMVVVAGIAFLSIFRA
ncbi:hypothetical protein F0562_017298 [Nyssa sinensis]|uniref:Phytocyanin domain-containing protein n=1 Tax=Nyssa sinensis TaxID=561372 RepID=A0A5J4ZGB8_9ASTE|nr:hypothetical protein F0562_017298 [Nyssa sinensis]